ncbi:unnamed protein product [Arctogadus glacialis]
MESHKGQVGNSITIQCSGWKVWFWTDIQSNDKYLCRDPCKNILIRARSQQTAQRDRIHLNNTGSQLTVTFTNLQMEDSGTYVCGVKESGIDSYKTFDLTVTDVVITTTSRPTAAKPAPTVTPDVFTTNQNASTNFPLSYGTQLGGKAIASTSIFLPCLLVGIVVVVALCLLIFIKCRNRKPSRTTERKKRVDEDTPEIFLIIIIK